MALWSWVGAFLFTQAVEVPIYLVGLRRREPPLSRRAAVAVAFGASTLTHPVVWFVMPGLTRAVLVALHRGGHHGVVDSDLFRTALYGTLCEGFAVGAEALYLRASRVPRPLRWALLANGASAAVGVACSALTGWP